MYLFVFYLLVVLSEEGLECSVEGEGQSSDLTIQLLTDPVGVYMC